MQGSISTDVCPRCGNPSLKAWDALGEDQKLLVEKLPASADYTILERKKHRFCTRCWYEENLRQDLRA